MSLDAPSAAITKESSRLHNGIDELRFHNRLGDEVEEALSLITELMPLLAKGKVLTTYSICHIVDTIYIDGIFNHRVF